MMKYQKKVCEGVDWFFKKLVGEFSFCVITVSGMPSYLLYLIYFIQSFMFPRDVQKMAPFSYETCCGLSASKRI